MLCWAEPLKRDMDLICRFRNPRISPATRVLDCIGRLVLWMNLQYPAAHRAAIFRMVITDIIDIGMRRVEQHWDACLIGRWWLMVDPSRNEWDMPPIP